MRARHAMHAAAIVIVTTLAYAGSFSGEWISDDTGLIVENQVLRSLAPSNWHALATTFDGPNYLPLNKLSHAIDYHFFGTDPTGPHVTNLVLHVANALLVYALLLRLGESAAVALVVAILWAVHPVQVESVAWISERKNLLSTLFFLVALLAYLRFSERPRLRTYALLFVLSVCALLSKINTIVLPAVTLAYELAERFRLRTRDVVATLPLLAAGAVVAWVNLAGNPSHGAHYHGGSLWVTLRTSSTVIPRYLSIVVAPFGLQTYYAVPLRASWLDPGVLAAVVLIVALAATAVLLALRRRRGGFWIAWFFITLSPMLNLVPFPALMADRYLYIPLVGPLVLLAWGAKALAARQARLGPALPVAAVLAIVTCTVLTIRRVPTFHDELGLWADWALTTPYISADQPYRGLPRLGEKRLLAEALERDHNSGPLHNNVGAIAFEEGRIPEAITELTRARMLAPGDPAIALNLGRAYLLGRQPEAAARTLEDAVRLEPPSYYAQLNLARAYIVLGDAPRARASLERARAIRPQWSDLRGVEAALIRLEHGAAPGGGGS